MIIKRFFLILSVALLFGCHTTKKGTVPAASAKQEKSTASEEDRIELDYLFFNANKEKLLGNNDVAIQLFSQVLVKDPKNDASMYALAQLFSQQKRFQEAYNYIKSAISIAPKNTWYQALYGDILEKNKMYADAAKVYEGLVKNDPDNLEYYFEWASALFFAEKTSDAIKVYDKLEDKIGVNPDLILQKEKLYIKLGKIDKAAAELDRLIAAFPKEAQYYVMLADLYQANNMAAKSLDVLNRLKQIDPDNGFVHFSLADYYRSIGDNDKSFEELKYGFASKTVDIETKFKILSSYFTLLEQHPELKDQAMTLNNIMVETHPNDAGSHVFYGEFLYQDKKFEGARNEFLRALQIDGKQFAVWQQLLRVELDLKNYKNLIAESDSALQLFPDQPLVYYLNGIARLQEKEYKTGVESLNKGVKLVVDNPPLKADFYANIGDAYYRLQNMKASDNAFNKALLLDPKNANTLNNYSYYLSVRGDSLEKAEKLSKLSNDLEPDNSYYQDTYGYILYKKGNFEDAKTWIEKAMKSRDGESGVIFEHYGDILYKLGQKEKAYEYWEKSKKIGGGSDLLDKKLSEKKLYE